MGQTPRATAETIVVEGGKFFWSGSELPVSSGRKRLLRGLYRAESGATEPAILTWYAEGEAGLAAYASELATLSRNSTLGVGPRLFAANGGPARDGFAYSLVQEDAGEPLDLVLFEGVAIPDVEEAPAASLAPLGTAERDIENAKIMFDVAVQALNLHRSGRYHRDLRAANICVKRCGASPADIRATVVDFDLASGPHTRDLYCENDHFRTLFGVLQGRDSGAGATVAADGKATGTASGGASVPASSLPSPFEIDSAYMQALAFELRTGRPIGELADPAELADSPWPLFKITPDGATFVRMVDQELDLDVLAQRAGLRQVDAELFPDAAQLAFVRREIKHGGYVDAYDLARIAREHPESEVLAVVDVVARLNHESYNRRMTAADPTFVGVAFDDLREDLAFSNLEQARSIPEKVAACGYRIVRIDQCDLGQRVVVFSDDEVEYLAALEHRRWVKERKDQGWVLGPKRDADRRMSPYLVPYDAVPEGVKELNRGFVRDIIPLLESMGLAVCR